MEQHIISDSAKISEALKALNALSGGVMTLIVTDGSGKMLGTVTDGDIRRALIGGVSMNESVIHAMNTSFTALEADISDLDRVLACRNARQKGIALLPEVDEDGRLTAIHNLRETKTLLPLSAILMAGGVGERLRPLTLATPKPLIEIDGRPIIDYNVENLAQCGITDVTVTVRYMADQIKQYFSRPCHGVNVKCLEESAPLGTIGAASLMPHKPGGDTIVMNADLLTTIDFEEMYLHHIETEADITIAAIPYSISVPYAILSTDKGQVKSIDEKPTYSQLANAGIYIISNNILNALPNSQRIDATDLVELSIANGDKVVSYPISGTWIDIGSHADLAHARELMRHHRTLKKTM